MTPRAVKLIATLAAIFLAVSTGALAAPGELRSQPGWQAERTFAIDWEPIAPPNPTEAVYEVRDSKGGLALSFRRPLQEMLLDVEVPTFPGVYTLEAWLENDSGGAGPRSQTTLRFDNAVPSPPEIEPPSGWILNTEPAAVQAAPAPDPQPLSGIGGLAVSVDRGGGSSPCAQPNRCQASEIDRAGGEGGAISLGMLPDGVHFVRAVTVSGTGVPSQPTTAVVRVDGGAPTLSLAGAPAGWSDRPLLVTAEATDSLSGMTAAGPLGPFTAVAVDGAPPARSFGGAVSTWIAGSGAHAVEYFARDAAGNTSAAKGATVRIDEDPPRVAFATVQDPAEPERIEATVSDPLSGPGLDRGSIGIRPSAANVPFQPLPTRNAGDRLVAHWDSDSYPPGQYEFVATAYDTAGNSGSGRDRARGGRMVLVSPLKAQVELMAGIDRHRLAGQLRRIGAGPVSGQDVVVTETFAPGSQPPQRTTTVSTDPKGAFSLRLKPGPSREVVAHFAGTAQLTRASSEATRIEAATRVRLRSSAAVARIGGRPIVFSGRVVRRGAATVAGLPVELEFRFQGGGWSEFRTVEADARGRFRYRYRFSDDDSRGVRFQFRAHVKGREGWPYGPGTSRPVIVTGR